MDSPLEIMVDTGGDDVHHPYTAFNQGFDAFDLGWSIDVNPYPSGRESDWWTIGWQEAKDQEDQPLTHCAGERDGDCHDARCPQLKNRMSHCPLDADVQTEPNEEK